MARAGQNQGEIKRRSMRSTDAGFFGRGAREAKSQEAGQGTATAPVHQVKVKRYFPVYIKHLELATRRGKARKSIGAKWLAQFTGCDQKFQRLSLRGLSDRGHLRFLFHPFSPSDSLVSLKLK